MKYYSQDGQDKFLAKLFSKKKGGYFLDIGAYDGVEFSNTYFLEKELGWNGICIEPNPIVFSKLKENRNCICINCCIGDIMGSASFLAVSGYGVMLSGLLQFLNEQHLKRIDDGILQYGGSKEIIVVEVMPVHKILDSNKITYIDYCNIDVEGGELSVLKTIDFSKIKIKVFTIENNYGSNEVYYFLKKQGYSRIYRLGADDVYELNSKNYFLMLRYRYLKLRTGLSYLKAGIKKFIRK
ncbi:MAG: FkbM family methyltransferase [Ferruginibacter sp.]|nr:FkbM family methyltransferase [Bacteroidota bacterium]MBX2920417.1 FkbM family methyltransferase [Ferruginibacter sp.]